jgi:predicted membrane chloride channel (bestrophin family)
MDVIKNFLRLLNLQTAIIILLSLLATYFCVLFDLAIELPTGLIGIAIVFPIVFSINAAYRRREEALQAFASLKAHAVAIFYAHRDWVPGKSSEHQNRIKRLIAEILQHLRNNFSDGIETEAEFQQIYSVFSKMSRSMEVLRSAGVSGSEISRANQYLRAMIIDFEKMRNILNYRTPTALRAYSQVFLNIFPILFAPYFADLSGKYFYSLGFLVAAFYSLVLVSLDNIQERLENPFDGVGVDDVNLEIADRYRQILTSEDKSE